MSTALKESPIYTMKRVTGRKGLEESRRRMFRGE